MAKEQLVINVSDGFGGKQTFVVEKVRPENEEQHIHICELLRVDGKTLAINHVRFFGRTFNERLWLQTGFNKQAVELVIKRYFKSLEHARKEARV